MSTTLTLGKAELSHLKEAIEVRIAMCEADYNMAKDDDWNRKAQVLIKQIHLIDIMSLLARLEPGEQSELQPQDKEPKS